ncbi:complement C1q-like protein 4 [Mya arenaria]|uniref:complement C1q-like protein 4 n=1 Tax=Mya arenaria TaxID=6604 RepID=UPI0022E43431|nr:complement C1q-like protein 4 [Mya arenaria]
MRELWIFLLCCCYCCCLTLNAEQTDDVADLKRDIEQLKAMMKEYMKDISELRELRAIDNNRLEHLERVNSELQHTVSELGAENLNFKEQLRLQESNSLPTPPASRKRFIVTPDAQVAFSVHVAGPQFTPANKAKIPYNTVDIDLGIGYDVSQHVFTCPENGVYFFHTGLYARGLDITKVNIVKEGTSLTMAGTRGDNTGDGYDQGSNCVVTSCNQGQRVWVEVSSMTTGAVDAGNKATSFTGFLLFQL